MTSERIEEMKWVEAKIFTNKETSLYDDLYRCYYTRIRETALVKQFNENEHLQFPDPSMNKAKKYIACQGMAFVCPSCGTESYKLYEYTNRAYAFIDKEDRFDRQYVHWWSKHSEYYYKKEPGIGHVVNICPICGKKEEVPFYRFNGKEPYESHFRSVYLEMEKKEIEAAQQEVEKNKKEFESLPVNQLFGSENIKTIQNSRDDLKDYIYQIINLEMDIYSISKRLEQLYIVREGLKRDAFQYGLKLKCKYEEDIIETETNLEILKRDLSDADKVTPEKLSIVYPSKPIAPVQPLLKKPGLFNRKQIEAENHQLAEEYNKKLEEYKHRLKQYETDYNTCQNEFEQKKANHISDLMQAVQNKEEELYALRDDIEKRVSYEVDVSEAMEAQKSILKEIEDAEKLLRELIQTKNSYYSINIIFIKYRNVVALSTFYEYLLAGRCESLEGPNGAYNIFEAEIRADRIIAQLSDVLDSLEKIQENQYLLYSELQEVNDNLKTLNEKTDRVINAVNKIEENSELIAYNSAVTAYYSKKTAQLANAIGWLVAFK